MSLVQESLPSARTYRYVDWALRHGRLIWAVAILLGVVAGWRTTRLYLGLRSDLESLLPTTAPSVTALQELRHRMPGIQILGIVIDSGTPENLPAAEKLADDLAASIEKYPPGLVSGVRKGIAAEREFLKRNAALYADLDDLKEIRRRIEARRDYEVGKATGTNLDDEGPPVVDFSDIEKKYKGKDNFGDRFPQDRYSNAKEHATVLLVEVAGYQTGVEKAGELVGRIQRDVAALGGTDKYAKGMHVAFTGDPAISLEELSALVADLTLSTVVVIVLVMVTLLLYYRWWRSVPAILGPLLLSTMYSFALASLLGVTELNSNTAFLGSIIIGNGINFGIVLVARYVEERRMGTEVREAIVMAVHATRVGTGTAAAAAGIAYGSLMVTQFRGFWQFGVIGGLGMAVCWAGTFLLIPPALKWLDRGGKAAPQPLSPSAFSITGPLARLVSRIPVPIVVVSVLLTMAVAWGSRSFGTQRFETDFSKLRRRDTWQVGEGYWGDRMDAVLGRYLSPVVILTDNPEQMRSIAAAIRAEASQPPFAQVLDFVRTADDVLPREQEEKIAEAREVRLTITPKIRSLIPEERRAEVDKILGSEDLKPITAKQLPPTFAIGLMEGDGSIDRAVLVYPKTTQATWQGEVIMAFAKKLREIAARYPAPDGRVPRVAGHGPLSADITESMERDGLRATVVALAGVVVLVLMAFRWSRETLLVLAALLTGVLWLAYGTVLFNIRLNFANFIGFPIAFGIGVDYAVNVMWRYKLDGGRDVVGAVKSTGGAVGMCSLTTIIGYSSLLLAQNQALFSFGLVSVIGEFTCLSTAVLVLPAALLVMDRPRPVALAG